MRRFARRLSRRLIRRRASEESEEEGKQNQTGQRGEQRSDYAAGTTTSGYPLYFGAYGASNSDVAFRVLQSLQSSIGKSPICGWQYSSRPHRNASDLSHLPEYTGSGVQVRSQGGRRLSLGDLDDPLAALQVVCLDDADPPLAVKVITSGFMKLLQLCEEAQSLKDLLSIDDLLATLLDRFSVRVCFGLAFFQSPSVIQRVICLMQRAATSFKSQSMFLLATKTRAPTREFFRHSPSSLPDSNASPHEAIHLSESAALRTVSFSEAKLPKGRQPDANQMAPLDGAFSLYEQSALPSSVGTSIGEKAPCQPFGQFSHQGSPSQEANPQHQWASLAILRFLIFMAEANVDFAIQLSLSQRFSATLGDLLIEGLAFHSLAYFMQRSLSHGTNYPSGIMAGPAGWGGSSGREEFRRFGERGRTGVDEGGRENSKSDLSNQPDGPSSPDPKESAESVPDHVPNHVPDHIPNHVPNSKTIEFASRLVDAEGCDFLPESSQFEQFGTMNPSLQPRWVEEFPLVGFYEMSGGREPDSEEYLKKGGLSGLSAYTGFPRMEAPVIETIEEARLIGDDGFARALQMASEMMDSEGLSMEEMGRVAALSALEVGGMEGADIAAGELEGMPSGKPVLGQPMEALGHSNGRTGLLSQSGLTGAESSPSQLAENGSVAASQSMRSGRSGVLVSRRSGCSEEEIMKDESNDDIAFERRSREEVMREYPHALQFFLFGQILVEIAQLGDVRSKLSLILEYYCEAEECDLFVVPTGLTLIDAVVTNPNLFDVVCHTTSLCSAIPRLLDRLVRAEWVIERHLSSGALNVPMTSIDQAELSSIGELMEAHAMQPAAAPRRRWPFRKKAARPHSQTEDALHLGPALSQPPRPVSGARMELLNLAACALIRLAGSCKNHEIHINASGRRPERFALPHTTAVCATTTCGVLDNCHFPSITALRGSTYYVRHIMSFLAQGHAEFWQTMSMLSPNESIMILESFNAALKHEGKVWKSARVAGTFNALCRCCYCGKPCPLVETPLRRARKDALPCTACYQVRYCSTECQEADTDIHSHFCCASGK